MEMALWKAPVLTYARPFMTGPDHSAEAPSLDWRLSLQHTGGGSPHPQHHPGLSPFPSWTLHDSSSASAPPLDLARSLWFPPWALRPREEVEGRRQALRSAHRLHCHPDRSQPGGHCAVPIAQMQTRGPRTYTSCPELPEHWPSGLCRHHRVLKTALSWPSTLSHA